MRTIAAFTGAHVTGITINEYQARPPALPSPAPGAARPPPPSLRCLPRPAPPRPDARPPAGR